MRKQISADPAKRSSVLGASHSTSPSTQQNPIKFTPGNPATKELHTCDYGRIADCTFDYKRLAACVSNAKEAKWIQMNGKHTFVSLVLRVISIMRLCVRPSVLPVAFNGFEPQSSLSLSVPLPFSLFLPASWRLSYKQQA